MARPNPIRPPRLAVARLLPTACLLATAAAAPRASAQTLKPAEVLSSISLTAVAPPRPVPGAGNRIHIDYELISGNTSRLFITLNKVESLDPGGDALGGLDGRALAAMIATYAGTGLTISPGGSAAVFMDTSFPAGAKLPPYIAPRVSITRQLAGSDGKPMLFPAGLALPPSVSFTGPKILLDTRSAVVIDPPLRGARRVAANGCCDALTSHRGAIMPVNGLQRVPERCSID